MAAFLKERAEHRVGHYFENLIHFWLRHLRAVEMVAHRQSVHDGERTVGELDFVFRDETGRLAHWEVAVKFYLVAPPLDGAAVRYLGPNTTDSLPRKIARMWEHQLPLSGRVYPDIAFRRAFVKGRIYRHFRAEREAVVLPELDPAHLEGVWIHGREAGAFAVLNIRRAVGFTVLRKPCWLTAPAGEHPIDEFVDVVGRHFRAASNALHVALFDQGGYEVQRLFVVPDDWPTPVG